MPRHSVTMTAVATGAAVGTYKSLLSVIFGNTTGYRGRVRKLSVQPDGEAAQDVNVSLRLTKTDNTSAGTATAVTPKKLDADSVATNATAGKNYTAEPTTVDSQHFWEGAINGRGGIVIEWAPNEGPKWGKNETLLLQGSPGAASAVKLSATIEWDE